MDVKHGEAFFVDDLRVRAGRTKRLLASSSSINGLTRLEGKGKRWGETHLSSFVDGPVFLAQFARHEIQIEGRFALAAPGSCSLAVLLSTLLRELFLLLSNLEFESGDLFFERCMRELFLPCLVSTLLCPVLERSAWLGGPMRWIPREWRTFCERLGALAGLFGASEET